MNPTLGYNYLPVTIHMMMSTLPLVTWQSFLYYHSYEEGPGKEARVSTALCTGVMEAFDLS